MELRKLIDHEEDQIGAVFFHQSHAVVVHHRSVLDGTRPGANGGFHSLGAMRVHGDIGAVFRRLGHSGVDFALGEFHRSG